MDVQPVDQGSVIRSGYAAVPDYMEQQIRAQLAGAQVQQAQTEAVRVAAAQQHQQQEQAELASYQADVANLGQNPTAADFTRIMVRHPAFSEAVNRAHQTQDAAHQQQTFQALAGINSAARAGNYALAARLLHERDAADTAAGQPADPLHAAIQAALESADPAQQQIGRDLLERATAAVAGPDHYAGVYGTFQRDLAEMNGVLYDKHTGEAVVQDQRGRIIPGSNGSFNQEPPIPGIPGFGGAPATSAPANAAPPSAPQPVAPGNLPRNGATMPAGMFQGWTVIGVPGDPRNRAGGRVVPHNGVDFRPPGANPHLVTDRPLDVIDVKPDHGISGITAIVQFPDGAQFNMMHLATPPHLGHYDAGQVVATAGNTGNARSGSTQIHVQPWGNTAHDPRAYFGGGVGTHSSPVVVRSVQQARALPVGTPYSTPDRRRFVR